MRLLAAVMLPTAGEVRILGFDTRRQAERIRREVGYMPQKFSLYGDLTVQENLDFFADVFGVRGSSGAGGSTSCWALPGWPNSPGAARPTSPVGCRRSWRWPARWCTRRR